MNDQQMVEIEVFNGICNVYASNGDITSCFDILHSLMDKKLPNNYVSDTDINNTLPSPNTFTFNTCLSSLVHCKDLHLDKDKKNIWRLVEFILNKMKELNVKRDCSTYSTLFNLCGNLNNPDIKPDLDKAIEFYLELSNTSIMISKNCMYSLLFTGLQFYESCHNTNDDNKPKRDKYEFIEWWMSEAKDYRIACNLSYTTTA